MLVFPLARRNPNWTERELYRRSPIMFGAATAKESPPPPPEPSGRDRSSGFGRRDPASCSASQVFPVRLACQEHPAGRVGPAYSRRAGRGQVWFGHHWACRAKRPADKLAGKWRKLPLAGLRKQREAGLRFLHRRWRCRTRKGVRRRQRRPLSAIEPNPADWNWRISPSLSPSRQ